MIVEELIDLIDPALAAVGFRDDEGEEFAQPPLDVVRYYHREVKVHWLPGIGRSRGVVAVVRQPVDLAGTEAGYRALMQRLSRAVGGRFPPGRKFGWGGIGLTAIVATPEPIGAEDDAFLVRSLTRPPRSRALPMGIIRVNLGQEAMAFQVTQGPDDLFPEAVRLADVMSTRFRRFVPLFDALEG